MLVLLISAAGLHPVAAEVDALKSITVRDVIEFAEIGNLQALDSGGWRANKAGIFSPDGKHVAVMIRKGNVAQGTNDATLLLFKTDELLDSPRPRVLSTFASATNYQPMGLVQWLDDNRTLLFGGAQGNSYSQVYSIDTTTGALTQLTQGDSNLVWFGMAPGGDRLVTMWRKLDEPLMSREDCLVNTCLVHRDSYHAFSLGWPEGSSVMKIHDLRSGEVRVVNDLASDDAIEKCWDRLEGGMSPDGRYGLRLCDNRIMTSDSWAEYTADPVLKKQIEQGVPGPAFRMALIDLDAGRAEWLDDAPYTLYQHRPIWIDSGKRFILPDARQTLKGSSGTERRLRASRYSVLVVDPRTGTVERVASLQEGTFRVAASWDDRTQHLSIEPRMIDDKPLPGQGFKRRGATWHRLEGKAAAVEASQSGIDLVIEQSLNDPPRLMATDPRSGARKLVLDPNPWLASRRLGKAEAVEWTLRGGRRWTGVLYCPDDYVPGKRYPLVIQTHGHELADRFSMTGYANNFAGRALTAQGLMLLQVSENHVFGPEEWPMVQDGYESAVDHFYKKGLIDRNKVGIQGWSRTGPHMGYTLVNSSYPFAAGAFTGTADFGWLWYILQGAPGMFDPDYGTAPFGNGINAWLKLSPSFNLHRLHTPMLMLGNGSGTALWDWYTILKKLNKPVEYWIAPDGTHDIFKVSQRLRNNQHLVDWFRFWLKDEEDPDPEKQDQYVRWRQLRVMQEAQTASAAASAGMADK